MPSMDPTGVVATLYTNLMKTAKWLIFVLSKKGVI
jgi:hypothetical protein